MTAKQFQAAIDRLGLNQVSVGRLFGYSRDGSTTRRWIRDNKTPHIVAILLRLMLAGKITIEDIESVR